jgi:hypothetical protein
MQKVKGSNPFSRFWTDLRTVPKVQEAPRIAGFFSFWAPSKWGLLRRSTHGVQKRPANPSLWLFGGARSGGRRQPGGIKVGVGRRPRFDLDSTGVAVRQRTPEELREQSKHLLYEVQMLFALGRYCETGEVDVAVARLDRAGLPVRNAVVEAFEIHARQLIEFFTHQRNRSRATAREWARGWSVPVAEVRELKALREAFSERVAHLSWKRSGFTRAEQLVLTHEIEGKLRPLILRFLAEAEPDGLCDGFVEETRLALAGAEAASEHPPPEGLTQLDLAPPHATQAIATTRGTATTTLSELKDVRRPS